MIQADDLVLGHLSRMSVWELPLWMHEPLPQPERGKLDSEVIDFEKQFARSEGTGAATYQLMRELKNKNAPALFAKLDQESSGSCQNTKSI